MTSVQGMRLQAGKEVAVGTLVMVLRTSTEQATQSVTCPGLIRMRAAGVTSPAAGVT
jgi:hypothetical protein